MKKAIATVLTVIILAASLMSLTAFAWKTPELMLMADYNEEKQTVTVYYRALDFAGTESADFRLRYDPDVLELADSESVKMKDVLVEIGQQSTMDDTIAIQFVDLYYVKEEDCDEDGSATIATLTFNIKDTSAAETVFIATTDSYNMDPNSVEVSPERATLKISLNEGSKSFSTVEGYVLSTAADSTDNSALTKIIIAAVVAAVVLVAGLVAVVVKYRKQ